MRAELLALVTLLTVSCKEEWRVVLDKRPGALISVWGTSASDVWTVGGDPGTGAEILHLEGGRWKRLVSPAPGDLWWVFGFAGGPVFMGGKDGLLLRYQGGALEAMTAPMASPKTVFGIWGPTPNDVWAVGGDGNGAGFVWRYDGTSWRDVPLPSGISAGFSMCKVFGRSDTEVYFVGSKGLAMKWDGSGFQTMPTGTNRTLFTLHGTSDRLVAVGGFGQAVLLELENGAWVDRSPAGLKQLIGVSVTPKRALAVGGNGTIAVSTESGWVADPPPSTVFADLHGAWIDPTGGLWAVGGQVAAFPLVDGVLLHKGASAPPSQVSDAK